MSGDYRRFINEPYMERQTWHKIPLAMQTHATCVHIYNFNVLPLFCLFLAKLA